MASVGEFPWSWFLEDCTQVKNTSSTTEPQASHRMKPSALGRLWLESVTEKVTGNAQPGECVDVLPRCSLQLLTRSPIFAWQELLRVEFLPFYLQKINKQSF